MSSQPALVDRQGPMEDGTQAVNHDTEDSHSDTADSSDSSDSTWVPSLKDFGNQAVINEPEGSSGLGPEDCPDGQGDAQSSGSEGTSQRLMSTRLHWGSQISSPPSDSSAMRMLMEDGGQPLDSRLNLADLMRDDASLRHIEDNEGGSVPGWPRGESREAKRVYNP